MFNPEQVLRLLNEARVAYLVIGGLASNLHGYDRATADLDLCYERSRDNVRRLVAVLRSLGAHPRGWPDGVPFVLDEQTILNGDNFTFTTAAGDVDILGTPSGSDGYADLVGGAERMEIDPNLVIAVVGLGDLIRLKRAAGRRKDLADLPDLEKLYELRGSAS